MGDRGCVHEDFGEFADIAARAQARDRQPHEEEADVRLEPGSGQRDCKISIKALLEACIARSQAFTRAPYGSYRAFSTRDRRSRAIVSTALVFSRSRIFSLKRSARRLSARDRSLVPVGSRGRYARN